MNKYILIIAVILMPLCCFYDLQSQTILVQADKPKHVFEGAGVSIGLYMGHHYSMNAANQNKAIKYIAGDCNMKYLQDYIDIYPDDDPGYFDKRANYIKAAKVYDPEIAVSLVGNKFPEDLLREMIIGEETLKVLNTNDPKIYDKLANWYFELFLGFYNRGVSIEILNVVNEPDLDRTHRIYHYGCNSDTKLGVAKIFSEAVPKFIDMLNNPDINTTGMKVPLIMGPSTISPQGCLEYIEYLKINYPTAWNLIDIVSTHQYIDGGLERSFRSIQDEIGEKLFYQSETHAFIGDNLGDLPLEKPHRTLLSLSNLFTTAVNNGVQSWFYFENNYPDEYHPGGLIRVNWATNNPYPYKHYYVFKQLTSSQPAYSNVLENLIYSGTKSDLISFRYMKEDTVYVHYSNYASTERAVKIKVQENQTDQGITAYQHFLCDNQTDGTIVDFDEYADKVEEITIVAPAYSVSTIKIAISDPLSSSQFFNPEQYVLSRSQNQICLNSQFEINEINLYSISGKLIKTIKGNRSNILHINTSNINQGIYIIDIYVNNKRYSEKIIL